MKQLILLLTFIGLIAQQAAAGNACNYSFRNPNLPTYFNAVRGNNASNGNSSNKAYFNTKDAVTRTFPTALQVRTGAISITEADFLALIQPNMRQELQTAVTATVSMNIGTADMNNAQTWTLPTGILSQFDLTRNFDFVAINDVPLTARIAGATHVNKRTYLDPDDGHTLVEYAHYQFDAGQQIQELGTTIVDVSDANAVANHSEAAQLYADSPFDLNDVFTNHSTDYKDDSDLPKTVKTNAVTVDGFGTINNPFGTGTLNCLRMSIVQINAEYTTDPNTPSSTTTQYFVSWITKEGFRICGQKASANPTPDGDGKVSLSNLEMVRFMPQSSLAVELLDFQGKTVKNGVDLTWTTASEKNNDYYTIERSTDGTTFEAVGKVKGNGTTTVTNNYQFHVASDATAGNNSVTYFRLKQTDFDRTSTTSNIIAISLNGDEQSIKIYPNPSNANTVSLELNENVEAVTLTNAIGQTVFQQKTNGQIFLTIDVTALAMGVYSVKTITSNGQSEVVKFVKN